MDTYEFIRSLEMSFSFADLSKKVDDARMVLWIPEQIIYYQFPRTSINVCVSDWHGADQWYMQLDCGDSNIILSLWEPNTKYHVEMTDAQRTAFISMREEYGEALTTTVQKKALERLEREALITGGRVLIIKSN